MLFNGFFSYAHADSSTDTSVFELLSSELQQRVQQRLANAKFSLWRDTQKLRVADKWASEIEKAVKDAHVFIAIISPSWLSSTVCMREYNTFLQKEKMEGEGHVDSIAPIIIRAIEPQLAHLTDMQTSIYSDVKSRQFTRRDITEISNMPPPERSAWIDKIADDVAGIIEKHRVALSAEAGQSLQPVRFSRAAERKEFSQRAYDFRTFDFIGDSELVLRGAHKRRSPIYCQLDFVDRLYVETKDGRVEFGIRRAILTLQENSGGKVSASDHVRNASPNVRYLKRHDSPAAIAISIDPPAGKTTLGELSLPPGPLAGDNRVAEVGFVDCGANTDITATVSVSINTEGLFLNSNNADNKRNSYITKVQAILSVAVEKYAGAKNGLIERSLEIRDERKP